MIWRWNKKPAQSDPFDWSAYLQERAKQSTDKRLQRFYQADWPASDAPISEVPMVALDLETTGLDAQHDVIISVGLVPFHMRRIHSPQARYWLVRPDKPLTSRSITFHRITHSAVANAPALNALFEDLMQALAGRLVVVHFKQIERHFLNAAAKQIFGESLLFPMIDTMAIERCHFQREPQPWWRQWLGHSRPSLRLNDCRSRSAAIRGAPRIGGRPGDSRTAASTTELSIQSRYPGECALGVSGYTFIVSSPLEVGRDLRQGKRFID